MPSLHYGPHLRVRLDEVAVQQAIEAIASHATPGGWVSLTDRDGMPWLLLVSAGIPIWVTNDE